MLTASSTTNPLAPIRSAAYSRGRKQPPVGKPPAGGFSLAEEMSSAKPIPHPVAQPYDSDQEVLEVVRRFEHLEFTPAEFAHAFHLAVGLAYLRQYPGAQALQKMRAGLQRMNAHYGRHGYHETITRFWVRMVEHGDRSVAGLPLFEAANRLTSEL